VEGESYQHITHNIRSCSNKLSELKIVYLNAHSILPKFDELVLMVQAREPDIVSIVESWLDRDVDDSEINISGYTKYLVQTEVAMVVEYLFVSRTM